MKGIIVRSRARWVEYGEKNSKYFLGLEQRNRMTTNIYELYLDSNCLVTSQDEILKVIKTFYSKLYSKVSDIDSSNFFKFLNIPHTVLTDEQMLACEGHLTIDECSKALASMALNKSPGSDGLPVDFYKIFWDDVGLLVVNLFNHAFTVGHLSVEQGRAIISLLPKPGKSSKYIKNWRPISLLNADYKICAKCIATRFKGVLPDIISPEQTGFLKKQIYWRKY